MTIRFCKACAGWHDLGEDWPEGCLSHFAKGLGSTSGIQIIRDIEPYKAVGGDIALKGKCPAIMGRRQHREFLKRNNYVEVGNEPVRPKKWDYGPEITHREIKQTIDQLRSRR
jgi:hypothetical protein